MKKNMSNHVFFSIQIFSCLPNGLMNLIFSIFLWNTTLFAGWHDRKAEGWAWYEEKKQPEKEETSHEQPLTSTQQMEEVRTNLEQKLAKAVLEPTPENIRTYMEEQQKWVDRSSYFAQVWAQVLLNYPHLDYTATHMPISQYGLQFYKNELQEEKEKLIASLAKEYGLVFFYEGKSEVSAIFGRIVDELTKKYGWETIAVSVDGSEIEGFTSSKTNNGIVQTLGVDITPALYLINPKENTVVPISFGLVAMDQIEENIALQFKELSKHD